MRTTTTFEVVGRHVFNVWRIMRSEQTLLNYTLENVVFNVLRKRCFNFLQYYSHYATTCAYFDHHRIPKYRHSTLTEWYHSTVPAHASRLLRYFSDRVAIVLQILDATEVITKTAEFARVHGVEFYSVLSRGSQVRRSAARIPQQETNMY
jgi:DNA polymerase zeta